MMDLAPHEQMRVLLYAARCEVGIATQELLRWKERSLVWAASNAEEAPASLLLAQAALLSTNKSYTWRKEALWYFIAANRLEKCGCYPTCTVRGFFLQNPQHRISRWRLDEPYRRRPHVLIEHINSLRICYHSRPLLNRRRTYNNPESRRIPLPFPPAEDSRSWETLVGPGDTVMEKKIWRKLDLYILPVVAMFYFLSFLDRSNIGNARVAGLQKDLKLSNDQYSIALTITYVPYIVAELPSNLLLKIVGPNLMLPTMLTLWGIVTTLQGVVTTYPGLLGCRFFLGLLEGGVFPGLVLYLSFFYPRQRLNWRISLFFSAASLSGAFSGLLAFGIMKMNGIGHKQGWEWIFILEGLFTVGFGITSYLLLPRSPEHARFLSEKEKAYIAAKLKQDGSTSKDESADNFSWREVGRAFTLPHVWVLAIVFFFTGTTLYALAYFTPSIVQGLGYTAARAQLMSVPPFAIAFVLGVISAHISDHFHCRGLVSIFSSLLSVIGFAMFLSSGKKSTQYASLFFSIPGSYIAAPTLSTWSANNTAPHTRRATAIAIGFIMTNSGGILATWLLGALSPAPRYFLGTKVLLAFSVLMVVFSALNIRYLSIENTKKAKIRQTSTLEQEEPGLGDRSAWFVYNL